MKISGATNIIGIFGYPVKHSFSPSMHNTAIEKLKINFAYIPLEVHPKEIKNAVQSLKSLNIKGVNVTIPHKEAVIKYLDNVDVLAKIIGSVNTIVNINGKLKGFNTDCTGFLKDLKDNGFNPKNKMILLVGAGGAGKAVATVLSWNGARQILITDFEESKAKKLSKGVKKSKFVSFKSWQTKIDDVDLLVNATPVGMHKSDPIVKSANLKKNLVIYDLVYNRKTELSQEAKKAKAKYIGGLGMLLNQGALAFELWTKKKAPINVMRKALLKSLKK